MARSHAPLAFRRRQHASRPCRRPRVIPLPRTGACAVPGNQRYVLRLGRIRARRARTSSQRRQAQGTVLAPPSTLAPYPSPEITEEAAAPQVTIPPTVVAITIDSAALLNPYLPRAKVDGVPTGGP